MSELDDAKDRAIRGLEAQVTELTALVERKDEALIGPTRCEGGCVLCSCDRKYIIDALSLTGPTALAERDKREYLEGWHDATKFAFERHQWRRSQGHTAIGHHVKGDMDAKTAALRAEGKS